MSNSHNVKVAAGGASAQLVVFPKNPDVYCLIKLIVIYTQVKADDGVCM